MRIAVPAGSKLYPIDRNPTNRLFIHSQYQVGPLGETVVWSYVVPIGRVFLATNILLVQRILVSSALDDMAHAYIRIAGQRAFYSVQVADALGNQDRFNIGLNTMFLQGVSFEAVKAIAGGAGVVQELGMIGIESDR